MSLDYEQSQYLNEQEARSNSFPWFSWGHVFSRMLSFASYLNWWKGKRDYSQPIPGMQSCIIGLLSWYCNHDLILVRFGITFLEDLKIFNMHKPCRLDYLLLFGKVSPCSSSGLERILDLREWWKSSLQTMSQILSNFNVANSFPWVVTIWIIALGMTVLQTRYKGQRSALVYAPQLGGGSVLMGPSKTWMILIDYYSKPSTYLYNFILWE